eukprot:2544513-Amphidinium_carterae.1
MWAADTDTPQNRQGVRVWRQLQGRAKELAEALSDATLMSSSGLTALLTPCTMERCSSPQKLILREHSSQ